MRRAKVLAVQGKKEKRKKKKRVRFVSSFYQYTTPEYLILILGDSSSESPILAVYQVTLKAYRDVNLQGDTLVSPPINSHLTGS